MTRVTVASYCERIDNSLWAEPLNAVTNAAFILVALLILRRLQQEGLSLRRFFDIGLLSLLLVVIGIGSLLWHTLATPWSEWADVIPILLFISVYLLSYLVRTAALAPGRAILWLLLFHTLNTAVQISLPQQTLNGSLFYLPTLATLYLFTFQAWRRGHYHTRSFLYASLLFTLSVSLRTVDKAICDAWPLGTHFLWHLLNAFVLYLLCSTLLPQKSPDAGQT